MAMPNQKPDAAAAALSAPTKSVESFSRSGKKPTKHGFVIEPKGMVPQKPAVVLSTPSPTPAAQRMDSPKNPQMESVDLPSLFAFYPFKKLFIRKFNVDDLLKIYDARAKRRFRHLVEAVSGTLHQVSAFDLTLEDFWYLLYWHRLNSYRKSPYKIDWLCSAPGHVKDVEDKKKEPKTLQNDIILSRSSIEVIDLEVERATLIVNAIKAEYDISVTPTMMHSYVEMMEAVEEEEKKPDDDKMAESEMMLYRYAMFMSQEHGASLKERAEALHKLQDPEFFVDMEDFIEVLTYGVKEKFKVTCKECGAKTEVENSIDALSFLPQLQRTGNIRP